MERLAELRKQLEEGCPGLELREDEPMSRHTTFRIGGPAALMALPRTVGEVKAAVKAARALGVEPFFLGNGSNLLVADGGYPGFVVKLAGDFDQIREVNRGLEAGSAVLLSRLSNALLGRGLTGLEFAGGIPGSVGGAVTMNAGAYGGEMKDVVKRVWYMDTEGRLLDCTGEELGFGYRKSAFMDGGKIITSAEFKLAHGDKDEIKARMDELKARRLEKQPYDMPSAGSTFKRPKTGYAAALIEQCGLKGRRAGGAQVSEKHTGFIVNTGGATCKDVLELMDIVRETVLKETGVELEPEVRVIGEN